MRKAKRYSLRIVIYLLMLSNYSCKESSRIVQEEGRLRIHELISKIFNNNRKLRVYVPEGYDKNKDRTYKVLYLNDGQNLFGDDTSGRAEWRVDEVIDSLTRQGNIEPMIVVGIDNAGQDRGKEYLPWEDKYLSPPISNPNGSNYPRFLLQEVIPFVEKNYPVKIGAANRGLGGSSYGGLITLYTALARPDEFGQLLIESPSLYVSDQEILKKCDSVRKKWIEKIFIGIGTNEISLPECDENNADNKMAVDDVRKLEMIIRSSGIPEQNLRTFVENCATHNEISWSRRFPGAIIFLYNKN